MEADDYYYGPDLPFAASRGSRLAERSRKRIGDDSTTYDRRQRSTAKILPEDDRGGRTIPGIRPLCLCALQVPRARSALNGLARPELEGDPPLGHLRGPTWCVGVVEEDAASRTATTIQ